MVSIHLWIGFLLLGSVFGASAPTLDQIIWQDADCPKITTKDDCLKVGFCYWLGLTDGNCKRDPCVGLPNGTDCKATALTCTNYYLLDDKTDCTTHQPVQEKQFCQAENITSDPPQVGDLTEGNFDLCLYSSIVGYLENRVDCNPVLCKWEKHKTTDKYVCVSNGLSDCSSLLGTPQAFCACLDQHKNEDYCGLFPYCIYNKSQCVFDQCTQNGISQSCPSDQGCEARSIIRSGGNADGQLADTLCVTKTRSYGNDNEKSQKVNQCYFTIDHSTDCGDKSACEASQTYADTEHKQDAAKCTLKPIAEGLFPTSSYCADVRSVPDPGSAIILRIPYLLLALALAVFFF